jgi:pumilio RNA-binding family
LERLENEPPAEQFGIVSWLIPSTLELALSENSCRVVQKMLDVAGGEARALLCEKLRGHVLELLYSPHGNHVLQKFVEVMPPTANQFVLDELETYKGGWATLARHKFGCRIEQRILEHCPESMTSKLSEAIVEASSSLCMHKFGNYVVQSVLEHGSDKTRARIVDALVQEGVATLAQDRVSSNVLERALHHCSIECKEQLVRAVLNVKGSLYDTACNRYGAFVVRQMLLVVEGTMRDEFLSELKGLSLTLSHEEIAEDSVQGA